MYILSFRQSKSKNFPDALVLAEKLGGYLENGLVKVEFPNVLEAYSKALNLLTIVSAWKSTTATYRGKAVHPYQFLLHAHWINDCKEKREIDQDCGGGWSCMKIDNLRYKIPDRPYKTHKYWYRYGSFKGDRWVIDKKKIYQMLLKYAEDKAITACPFFDESKLYAAVAGLPDYIIPDEVTFATTYRERYADGQKVQVPDNILHLGYLGRHHLKD